MMRGLDEHLDNYGNPGPSAVRQVKASDLKPGMVVLDPTTGKPGIEIDHKMRTVRNSGEVRYFALDYLIGQYAEFGFRPSLILNVQEI